jgi:hypothetical protein
VPLSLANAINVHTPPRASKKKSLDAVVSLLNCVRSGADATTVVTFMTIESDIDPAPPKVKLAPTEQTNNGD